MGSFCLRIHLCNNSSSSLRSGHWWSHWTKKFRQELMSDAFGEGAGNAQPCRHGDIWPLEKVLNPYQGIIMTQIGATLDPLSHSGPPVPRSLRGPLFMAVLGIASFWHYHVSLWDSNTVSVSVSVVTNQIHCLYIDSLGLYLYSYLLFFICSFIFFILCSVLAFSDVSQLQFCLALSASPDDWKNIIFIFMHSTWHQGEDYLLLFC